MEHELGPEISVDGMPSWLESDEEVKPRWGENKWYEYTAPAYCVASPKSVTAIRLRADHPYYLATSKGFTYWPGGADAPECDEVLFRGGGVFDWENGLHWDDTGCESDIIGYRKRLVPQQKPATPTRPSDELVKRMVAFIKECADNCDEEAVAIFAALNPDPMIQRARDICKDEFGVILPDDAPGMRAVLRGLREGGE